MPGFLFLYVLVFFGSGLVFWLRERGWEGEIFLSSVLFHYSLSDQWSFSPLSSAIFEGVCSSFVAVTRDLSASSVLCFCVFSLTHFFQCPFFSTLLFLVSLLLVWPRLCALLSQGERACGALVDLSLRVLSPRPLALAAHETRSVCGGGRRYGSLWNPHSLLPRGFVCMLLMLFPCVFSSVAWEPYLGSSHQQSVSSFPLPLIFASYVEARWFSSVRSVHVSS